MLAVGLLPLLQGRLSWTETAHDMLAVSTSFDFPAIKLALIDTFSWPDLTPRLSVYFGLSLSLIALQYGFPALKALFDYADYFTPLLDPPGPGEKRVGLIFSSITWWPFRSATDLIRTAIESTVAARKDFLYVVYGVNRRDGKVVYHGTIKTAFGDRIGGTIEYLPTPVLLGLGPFLVAWSHPRTKIFTKDTTDKVVQDWASDELCLAYTSVILKDNSNVTGKALKALMKCVWLESLNIEGCDKITGDTKDFSGLVELTSLNIYGCDKITGPTDIDDIKALADEE